MEIGPGRRERKKQQTRRLILDTASELFQQRGFEAVTVAQIARAADLSEVTVFNYFSTKEDLFFGGMESFEERLLDAVRSRPPGESVLVAFKRLVVGGTERLKADETAGLIARGAAMIESSPALKARETMIADHYADLLAQVIAAETHAPAGSVEPWAAAGALMAVQRALVRYVRISVAAGMRGSALASAARLQARRGFARLEKGIGDYAKMRR